MSPPPQPPGFSELSDDPLLPFAIAAKAGDEAAERELLLRLTPIVLEAGRRALGSDPSQLFELTRQVLVAMLKALPALGGDEPLAETAARITLHRAQITGLPLLSSEESILSAARQWQSRAAPDRDARVASLVDQAMDDDAAVLVSHIAVTRPARSGRAAYILGGLAMLLLASLLAWIFGQRLRQWRDSEQRLVHDQEEASQAGCNQDRQHQLAQN